MIKLWWGRKTAEICCRKLVDRSPEHKNENGVEGHIENRMEDPDSE